MPGRSFSRGAGRALTSGERVSNDPLSIHVDKVTELLRGFGLDPVDPKTIRSVHIDPDGVEVVRHRLDDKGGVTIVGDDIATETVTIRLHR